MPLGRICPGCHEIYAGASCRCGCRPGGKRTTPRRGRNQKVWSSAAHRKQRIRIFRRDDYTCQRCCRYRDDSESGKGLIADHVHGIDDRATYPDFELQTLCLPCSGRKDGARGRR